VGTTRAHLVALDPPDEPLGTAGLEASLGTPVPLPALELPRARRPGWPTLAALAVACGLAAVLLGAWALLATVRSDGAPAPAPTLERSVAVLTDARAERIPLHGSLGRITLVVGEDGTAVLALDGLGAAPEGRVYAAWLVRPGSATPLPTGTFTGTERVVFLERPVPRGGRVGMTLESDPPPDRPSRPLRLAAVRP
jgi:hypothetical protein